MIMCTLAPRDNNSRANRRTRYFRPAEVETLLGDPTKAHEKLGWKPEITLREMVSEMVANDLEAAKKHSLLKSHGYDVAIALES